MFVDDGACQVAVGFVGTLHENLHSLRVACINSHADRIEANHLLDGVGQRFPSNGSGDAEVLQFVVEEHNSIVGLLLCEPIEGIRDGHIIIFT